MKFGTLVPLDVQIDFGPFSCQLFCDTNAYYGVFDVVSVATFFIDFFLNSFNYSYNNLYM